MHLTVGDLKQGILKVYNSINQDIVNTGVRQQNVDFIGNKIVIPSLNTRVPVLKVLDEENADAAQYFNFLAIRVFKRKLKEALEQQFQLNIVAIFKDYDVKTEYSGTIICLDRDVEKYLNESSEL